MIVLPGVTVKFSPSVVARCGPVAGKMRGTVLRLTCHGKVAVVDCGGTWDAEDGRTVRSIPTNNLSGIAP